MPTMPKTRSVYLSQLACAAVLVVTAGCPDDSGGPGKDGHGGPLGDGDHSGSGDGDGSGSGDGDGDDWGSGDGDGSGSGDGDACQSVFVRPQRVAPHMLILFDRSQSMSTFNRWNPSVSAVKDLTGALDD